jgi:hypothetical protein
VFSSFVAFERLDAADAEALIPIAGTSGLFYEFAAASADELMLDELRFAALHASLMAGQWASSTSVVSLRPGEGEEGGGDAQSVTAQLVLSQDDDSTTVRAEVVLARTGSLELRSPLANIDVEFGGHISITSTSASIDLGPEVFLRAQSVELAGSSLQISKDASSGEVSGPTVELVADRFETQAALIGSVSPSDFVIAVPPSWKLSYPWVQFRGEPDEDAPDADPNTRARRFLNKLMSLARRHGHRGQRAVFIKKLEGRQGLRTEEFQRAIATLVRLGVVREAGVMLFLTDEWDQHRYDGKGREGMTSYEDKRAVWDPVVAELGSAIEA